MHGLKQNRWPLAWVEQSHLSNLSILYGEWSEPCTRVSFCVLLSRDLMAPPPPNPTPPPTHTHTNGELARRLSSLYKRQWSQEWILSFLIHETGLIEKPSYNRNLNRALLINLRQPRWRYKKCCWMPPYLTVSYTSLSSEAHRPTPQHGQYITHALIILAVAAMDNCLIAALEKKKQKTNCIKHHLQMFMLVDSCYFDIRCLRRL